ncbi:methyl-accepting chemotaxis protein [Chakrabartia godavariana]|nr:methyl-accepting chemotaxis protein [Chakrabartia godavariana]
MKIQRISQIGAGVMGGLFVLATVVGAYDVNYVRIGGTLHAREQAAADLLADSMPATLYVSDPYLTASRVMLGNVSPAAAERDLAELRKSYEERQALWEKEENLSEDIHAFYKDKVMPSGDRFWDELQTGFIPAMKSGNMDAARASYGQLTKLHDENDALIQQAIKDLNKADDEIEGEASSGVVSASIQLGLIMLLLASAVGAAVWFLMRKILAPTNGMIAVMDKMTGGNYDVAILGKDREDEIGDMARSIEVFRVAAKERQEDEAAQRIVVAELASGLKAIADGNLTHRITVQFAPKYDSLRGDFNDAVEELNSVVGRVSRSATSVNTGSTEISTAADDLARRTEQQAASLEETAAAMNEVTQSVRSASENARTANQAVGQAMDEATNGGKVVGEAVTAMGDIEKSAQEISQIINVIDGIAFQTNLLALNAGVEAARAGDAGKGFAVVANEVRALAQRSADAAKDIKQLITESNVQVEKGVSLVGKTGDMLARIGEQVEQISGLVSGISAAAESQAASLQQINIAVGDMDKMTQQNAAMVEESTAASRSLAGEASELAELVARFRTSLSEEVSRSTARAPAAASVARIKPAPRKAARVVGNLAVKQDLADEDWSEF